MRIKAIQKLGGRAAVAGRMRAVIGARAPSVDAIRMWEVRNSVPGYAITEMLEWAKERGLHLEPEDFRVIPRTAA